LCGIFGILKAKDRLGISVRDPCNKAARLRNRQFFSLEEVKAASRTTSKQVAFAECLARIEQRSLPDECFRDKGLMSKWNDGNR
jgi:hypothetical protein